jgi:class 3 adenylate cyclase/predicted ATPase
MHRLVDQPDSIENWLKNLGLEKYATLFEDNGIGLDILTHIDNSDLKELEIPLGDRKRILAAIERLGSGEAANQNAHAGNIAPVSTTGAEKFVERRQLTVLFCDLVGSTGLSSRLDPEDLSDTIRNYQKVCDRLVTKWDGFTAQYLGDGILAYFGWPVAHEDDAQRAILAGFELAQATGQMTATDGTVLAARVGIATGLVMVGEMIGEGSAQQETAIGVTPNVAAKIQSFAMPGSVAIADSTREIVGDKFDLTDLGEHTIAGVEQAIRIWAVDGLRSDADWLPAGTGQQMAPLVGRENEIRQLKSLWNVAKTGKGKAVRIIGEAGVGKTGLVQAFYNTVTSNSNRLVRLQGSSFHTNTPLFPIVEEISRLLGITGKEPGSRHLVNIVASVESAGMEREPATSLIASLLELPVELHASAHGLSRKLRRERTMEILVNLLTWSSTDKPLMIIVEDVHWIDPSTRVVIDKIMARTAKAPMLVLLTGRPDSSPGGWNDQTGIEHLDLAPLSNIQTEQLILQQTDGLALPEDAISTIVSNTDGVPLFVKELTKAVLESGQLTKTDSGYELKETVLQLDIPSTLQASLSARLDQRPSAKPVAQAAATIGRSFSSDLLGFITGIAPDILHQHLDSLCDLGVLVKENADTSRYNFTHALVQETAYLSQLKARRREVHGQIAGALQGPFSVASENRPIILAHHLAGAGDIARAADQYLLAGRSAISDSAVEEATAHLNKGLQLLQSLGASQQRDLLEMRLQASIGTALMLSNGWAAPEVHDAYTRASQLSEAAQDPQEQLWILWGAWVSRNASGRINQTQAMSEQIRIVAEESENRDSLLIGDMVSLQRAFYSGQFGDAIQYSRSMRERFSPDDHRSLVNLYSTDLELVAMVHQSIALWVTGAPDEALELVELTERTARTLNHSYSLSWMLVWGATVPILCGAWQEARTLVQEGLTIAQTQGYDYVISFGRFYLGYIEIHDCDDRSGVDEMIAGADGFRSTGAEIVVPHFWTMIAAVQSDFGAPDKALELLQRAEDRVTQFGETWQECEIYRSRAEAMRKLGGFGDEAIEAAFHKAIDLAVEQGAVSWQLRAASGLANHLSAIDRSDEAVDLLSKVVSQVKKATRCADYFAAQQLLQRLGNANDTNPGS